jgi:peptidoglycan/LPS O-acetylase OafA/YrhL
MFVTTPTFSGKKMAWFGLVGAVVLKLISVWVGEFPIYALSKLFANEIWFVGGMVLAATNSERRLRRWPCLPIGCALSVAFLILSVFVYDQNASLPMMPVMMGILGCTSVVMIMGCVFAAGERHPAWAFMARYTMPIFLMHTIFAAGWRTVLLKIGVISVPVHMISGLVVSFIGPMIAAEVMKRVKLLDALIAPGKYIKRDP